MIGVDTNVLLRFLVVDDPVQHAAAKAFFDARSPENPAFVSALVLMETVWLLRRRLRYSGEVVADAIRGLLDSDDFLIEHGQRLHAVLSDRAGLKADMADYLVAWASERNGCTHTVTFDKNAARAVPAMELLA